MTPFIFFSWFIMELSLVYKISRLKKYQKMYLQSQTWPNRNSSKKTLPLGTYLVKSQRGLLEQYFRSLQIHQNLKLKNIWLQQFLKSAFKIKMMYCVPKSGQILANRMGFTKILRFWAYWAYQGSEIPKCLCSPMFS